MDKTVKKAFLIGLGISLLTKEKIEKEVHQHMKKYKISEKDSKKLAKKIVKESMQHKKDIEQKIKLAEHELAKHAQGLANFAEELSKK